MRTTAVTQSSAPRQPMGLTPTNSVNGTVILQINTFEALLDALCANVGTLEDRLAPVLLIHGPSGQTGKDGPGGPTTLASRLAALNQRLGAICDGITEISNRIDI